MTGFALISALALLISSPPPRRRLMAPRSGRRTAAFGARPLAWVAGCGVVAAALVLPLPTMLAVIVLGATTALRFRRRHRAWRGAQEDRALETALDVLVGELRVGAHPVQAFGVAAEEAGGTVGGSLRAVAARARLGADVAAGLRASARASARSAHWERLAVSWQLASEHGLAIAILMRSAQRDIAERQRFSARVTSGMAGARATAAILAGLPVLGVAMGQLIGARPVGFLLGTHAGGWLLLVGVALTCAGLWWSDRITDRVAA